MESSGPVPSSSTCSTTPSAQVRQAQAMTGHDRFTLSSILNMASLPGRPDVHKVGLTKADGVVGRIYGRVKRGEHSSLKRDLATLGEVIATSVGVQGNDDRHVSNVYLGKTFNVLCKVAAQEQLQAGCEGELKALAEGCCQLAAQRTDFNFYNLTLLMFHLGELVRHARFDDPCQRVLCGHMAPLFNAMLPGQWGKVQSICIEFGLTSVMRASALEMLRADPSQPLRSPADALILTVLALLDHYPASLSAWTNQDIAWLCKSCSQYLGKLDRISVRRPGQQAFTAMRVNAARLLTRLIEEMGQPGPPGRAEVFHRGFPLRDESMICIRNAAFHYDHWIQREPPEVRQQLAVEGAARRRKEVPVTVSIAGPAPDPPSPGAAFHRVMIDLAALRGRDDRFDRERVVAMANALVADIEAGRAQLSTRERGQFLQDLDNLCSRLASLPLLDRWRYQWQLSAYAAFRASDLRGS